MAPSITLRPFREGDLATALPWFADPESDDFAGGPEMLERHLAPANEGVYVAELDGAPVAVVSAIFARGPSALINPLVVAPESRGLGVGRAVLEALTALPEFEDHELFANVDAENPASVRCFEAAGYERDPARSSHGNMRLQRPRSRWTGRR